MAILTDAQFKSIFPTLSKERREEYLPHLNLSMACFEINTERRIAMYCAQLKHESMNLTRWLENMNYSAKRMTQVWPSRFKTIASAQPYAYNPRKLANKVYNGRMGNRENTDDGYNYRGRCPIQATGRAMYAELTREFGAKMGVDFVKDPDLLLQARYGFMAAAYIFAVDKNCLTHADNNNIERCTRAINGGTVGLTERKENWEHALRVLPDGFRLDTYAEMQIFYDVENLPMALAPDIDERIPVELNPDVIDIEPVLTVREDVAQPNPSIEAEKGLEGLKTSEITLSDDSTTGTPPPPSGAADNASVADGALSPQILEKERPSIFTRAMTAVFTFLGTVLTGAASWFGGNEVATALAQKGGERIIDNTDRSDWAQFGMVTLYVVVIGGIGLLLFWIASEIYQRSADRSNKLNSEKMALAGRKDLNTVEFKK